MCCQPYACMLTDPASTGRCRNPSPSWSHTVKRAIWTSCSTSLNFSRGPQFLHAVSNLTRTFLGLSKLFSAFGLKLLPINTAATFQIWLARRLPDVALLLTWPHPQAGNHVPSARHCKFWSDADESAMETAHSTGSFTISISLVAI